VGSGLDDNLREIQGVIVRGLSNKGADIASATTTDLGAVEGLMHDITGTTTITSFGTVRAGIWKVIKFEGALTLTHNAASLILPGAANITTADGDVAIVISEGSGNWRCLNYARASVSPLVAASDTAAGAIEIAIQSEMETATDTTRAVVPGRQQYHPSAAKGWVKCDTAGNAVASFNTASVTDQGTGQVRPVWNVDFSSVEYCVVATAQSDGDLNCTVHNSVAPATTDTVINIFNSSSSLTDPNYTYVAVYGDQ